VRSHVLPHLVAPVIVLRTLVVAGFVLAETGLSFLGLGVELPTASWGNLLSEGPNFYRVQPWLMICPGRPSSSRRSRSTSWATACGTPSTREAAVSHDAPARSGSRALPASWPRSFEWGTSESHRLDAG
jgi:hypothetical protein